jgi:hypothetical protein
MKIESSASGMSQAPLVQSAEMQVLKMALNRSELQGQAIQKLLASAEIIQDPALGQNIDISA